MEQRDNPVEQPMENTSNTQQGERAERWPALPFEAWKDTCQTLHMWTQIVGRVRMELTLLSGRRAPERPGANRITREAYSHEVISCGFWPGDDRFPAPAFYSYTSPEPPGLATASIRPQEAFYRQGLGLFLLRYDDVRTASSPEQVLLEFFQSTYEAGARLAQWDREALERKAR